MKTYRCPRCGSEVTPNDINVAKDIMLCPSCGETSSFAEVVAKSREATNENEGLRILSAPPPKHLKVVSDPTDISGRITLVYRKISPMALFLVPFTCAWAGGSLSMIYGTQIAKGQFNLQQSLLGLPFLIGSIVLISISLFMLFGKRTLSLQRGNGKYFFGVGPIGFSRRFIYDHQTKIEYGETNYTVGGHHGQGGHPLGELHLNRANSSDTIHICAGMSEDALDYVAAVLRREARTI